MIPGDRSMSSVLIVFWEKFAARAHSATLLSFQLCRRRCRGDRTGVGNIAQQGIVRPDASPGPGVEVPVWQDVVPSTIVAHEPLFPQAAPVVPVRRVLGEAAGWELEVSGRNRWGRGNKARRLRL